MTDTKRRSTVGYYAAFVGFGLVIAALGPSLDTLRERASVDRGTIAVLFTTNALGYAIGSMLLGRRFDSRPGHPMLRTWLGVAAVGTVALAGAQSLLLQATAVALIGFAGGGIDTGANALLARIHAPTPSRALVGLHAMFGVGASCAPLVLAISRRATDGIGAGLVVIAAVLALAAAIVGSVPSPRLPTLSDDDRTSVAPPRPVLAAVAAFFFLYVGLEIVVAGWIFPYATDLGFDASSGASWLTTGFWLSFTAGRIASIRLTRIAPQHLLAADFALAFTAAVLLGVAGDDLVLIWIATLGLGLGLATMFPAMLTHAHGTIGLSGTTTGWFIAGSGAGSALLPWAVGQLFDTAGSEVLPMCVVAATLACAAAAWNATRAARRAASDLDVSSLGT